MMCHVGAVEFGHRAILPIVVMQSAELQPCLFDRPRQLDNIGHSRLLDPGAIHSGVDVDESTHPAAAPLIDVRRVLNQNRDYYVTILLADFAHTAGIRAYR